MEKSMSIDETNETDENDENDEVDELDEADEFDELEEEEIVDSESLNGAIAALVDMYYLDEILVALAREIQAKGTDDSSSLGDAFRGDARALRKAIGKLSGET
jgi:hypothetical protein